MSLGYECPMLFYRIVENNVDGGNDMPGLIEEPVLTKKETVSYTHLTLPTILLV